MKPTPKIMWAIYNERGWRVVRAPYFYVGTHFTRRETIREHTEQKGCTWAECRAAGDRATKVKVYPI